MNQIQQTAINSQRALSVTKSTQAVKERERRILQLTINEVDSLDKDVNLYKGVGKMYVCWQIRIVTRAYLDTHEGLWWLHGL